MTNVKLVL